MIHCRTAGEGLALEMKGIGEARHGRRDGRPVVAQHEGHQHGIGQPVMMALEGADGMAERMHGPQPLAESRGAHDGGGHHMAARLDIARLRHCYRQPAPNQGDAGGRDRIRHGVIARDAERFQIMAEGIHARGGRKLRRQADGERRIGDHDLGQHGGMHWRASPAPPSVMTAGLDSAPCRPWWMAMMGKARVGCASDRARRSAGGPSQAARWRWSWRNRGRCRAERDDSIGAMASEGGHARLDIAARGILMHLGEETGLYVRSTRCIADEARDRRGGEAAIGYDQRPAKAETPADIAQLRDAPAAETDLRRKQPIAAQDRQRSLAHPHSSPSGREYGARPLTGQTANCSIEQ
jgi:hypothetical protein